MTLTIGASVAIFARSLDARQMTTEQKIVSSAINDASTKLGDALRPNTYWDDAYNHLVIGNVDAKWAEKNLGPYARDTSGVSVLLLMPKSGRSFYSFLGTESDRKVTDYENNGAVKALIREAQSRTVAPPAIATGFVRIGDRIYLGAASQIVPNDERAKRPLERHNVEIYLQAFGTERISKVQHDFQLSTVSLSVTAPPKNMAFINLRDAAGLSIGYLWWRPSTPGSTLAISVAPYALFIVAAIGILLSLVLRNWAATLDRLKKEKIETNNLRHEILAKSAFIGTISHELRTPLNAILGFSEIFLKQIFGPLGSDNYREYAQYIHSSGQSLLCGINDVIEFSSIEANEKKLTAESVNAVRLVGDALDDVGETARAKGIQVKLSAPDAGMSVLTSVSAIHEILVRLLDNAIKFSYPEGVVEVAVENCDGGVTIRISDNGAGIAQEMVPLLGRPFSQVEGHLQRSNRGLGLGLAISFGLARLLGASIAIKSSLGLGTAVTVHIPAATLQCRELRAA